MNLRTKIFFGAFFFLTSQVEAITIFGGADCGQWFNEARRPSAKIWLNGYLSAMNAVLSNQSNDTLGKLKSIEQAYLWIDNYCKANPLNDTQEAAHALFKELKSK